MPYGDLSSTGIISSGRGQAAWYLVCESCTVADQLDQVESITMSTNSSSLRMTLADPDRHLMAISQITSDAFAGGQYVEEISQQYIGNCHYDWDTSRLIWDGERLVHHWGVWGYPHAAGVGPPESSRCCISMLTATFVLGLSQHTAGISTPIRS